MLAFRGPYSSLLVTLLCIGIALLAGVAPQEVPSPAWAEPATPEAGAGPIPPPTVTAASKLVATVNQVADNKFPLVVGYVSVIEDNGTPITGLAIGDFQTYEDGLPVPRLELTTTVNLQEPLAVALVLDISGSMAGKSLEYAKQGAASFLDVLEPRDLVELVSFSSDVKVNIPFTTTKPLLGRGIDNLRAGGDTALYDAVATAAVSLARLGPGRRVAVLLTDGSDTKSRRKLDETLALVADQHVPVFIVGLGDEIDRDVLTQIAQGSGGSVVFAPSALDLGRSYRTLADQLRSQYAITFSSGLKADDKAHKLLVRVQRRGATAEAQGIFVGQRNPPWLDIVTPKTRQVITTTQQIEVVAQANSPAASIKNVDFVVDGKGIGNAARAPYVHSLDANDLMEGSHVLTIRVEDSAGNTASQEIGFTSERAMAIASPTAVPSEPTPVPEPTESVAKVATNVDLPVLPVAAGVSLVVSIGIAGRIAGKRSRQRPTFTCPQCGTVYGGRTYCPTCELEHRHRLLRRLHEILEGTPRERPATNTPVGPKERR